MSPVVCFSLRRLIACDVQPIARFGLLDWPYAFVMVAFIAGLYFCHLLSSPIGQRLTLHVGIVRPYREHVGCFHARAHLE